MTFFVVVRYKTRAHKAEARLQEEAGKQKTMNTASDTREASGVVAEQAMQTKVWLFLTGPWQLFMQVMIFVSGEEFAGRKESTGGQVGST